MSDLPHRARVVIIGGGIMGSALAHHLALLGWRDLVLVDQGPFPNTGGSTGHSSAMVWLPEASRLLTAASAESVRQYRELGVHKTVGGLDLARTPARMADFRRRLGFIRTWGDYEAELLSPAEIRRLVPYLDETVILGGLHLPATGVVDAIRAATLMREQAAAAGALQSFPLTEVTGLDVEAGRIAAVRTDRGRILAERVVICCGVWSPRLAGMVGARIPFTPGIQQLVSVGPIAAFANLSGEISFPVIRDSDPKIYARRVGGDMELGFAGHRPILWDPDEIPSLAEATLTPTELPFTSDDFDPALESALELFPDLFADEQAGIRYAINGLSSMSADGLPIIGEQPEVGGLWSANRVDIKMAPAVARTLASWLVNGMPEAALHSFDLARFLPHERAAGHVEARAAEGWRRMYEPVHPARESAADRGTRRSPLHDRLVALGAEFGEQAGWEIPKWYRANAPLLAQHGERVMPRPHEWDARWWSPIINAEHLSMREGAGIEDLSGQSAFEISGPGAGPWLDGLAVDRTGPGTVRTWLLDPAGGIVEEVLVLRRGLAPSRFLLLATPGAEARLGQWLRRHLPADGSVAVTDVAGTLAGIGIWGGRAGALVAAAIGAEARDATGRSGGSAAARVAGGEALVARTDRLGDPGWEVYVAAEAGPAAWDSLLSLGSPLGAVPVGTGVSGTTARLEAGIRSRALDFVGGYSLVESGWRGPLRSGPFSGRDALQRQLATPPAAILCTLAVDDHRGPDGVARFMLGTEPLLGRDGRILVDARGRRSFVTSAGSAPSLHRHLLMGYLPAAEAVIGNRLVVECFGDPYPVTVVADQPGAVHISSID